MPVPEPGIERVQPYVPRALHQHLVDDRTFKAGPKTARQRSSTSPDSLNSPNSSRARAARAPSRSPTPSETASSRSFESPTKTARAYSSSAATRFCCGSTARHAARACRAAVLMRQVLHEVGRIELPGAKVTLQMSQGVHSGRFHFFAVGTSHLELVTTGPRVEPPRHAGARGRRGRDPRQHRDSRGAAGRVPGRAQGTRPPPARRCLRAILRRCRCTAVARRCVRDAGALPSHRDPRTRPRRRRDAGAPSRHDCIHPLRRHRRADRTERSGGGCRCAASPGERDRVGHRGSRACRSSPPTSTPTAAS